MKKILSMILALAMVMSLSVTVFAANPDTHTDVGGSSDVAITANYNGQSDTVGTVYHVTVSWAQTGTITYTNAYATYTWNPAETGENAMQYVKSDAHDAKWTCENAAVAITVVNRSNAAIQATCAAPVGVGSVTGIAGSYDKNTLTLDSAAPEHTSEQTGTPKMDTATYTITNVTGEISANDTIATITVSINAAP